MRPAIGQRLPKPNQSSASVRPPRSTNASPPEKTEKASTATRTKSQGDELTERKKGLIDHPKAGTKDDVTFTCPDGRRLLQVVQTRFLLGQSNTSASYIASRLVLMNTFFVGSLNGQTRQNFVLVIHYEASMRPEIMGAVREVVSGLKIPVIYYMAENKNFRVENAKSVSFKVVKKQLVAEGHLPKGYTTPDIYLTSRLDIDDAVHKLAVESYQDYACTIPASDGIGKCAPRMRLIYPTKKVMWKPSSDTYGALGIWESEFRLDRWLPILSTMVVIGKNAVRNMQMNIYGFNHVIPWSVTDSGSKDTVCYKFNRDKHLFEWVPPNPKHYSGLYSRTAGASTIGVNKTIIDIGSANPKVLGQFGIIMPDLVATNALFNGLQQENEAALKGKMSKTTYRRLLKMWLAKQR